MPDNVVSVAIEATTTGVDSGMQSAASSVDDAYSQMAASFAGIEAAAAKAAEVVTGSWYDIVAASETGQESSRRTAEVMIAAAEAASESYRKFGETIRNLVENPLHALGSAAQVVAEALGPVGVAAAATGATLAVVAVEAYRTVAEFASAASAASNLAARLGLTTAQAMQLKAEGDLLALGIGSLSVASYKLGQALEDPTGQGKTAADALNKLGVQMFTAEGTSRELGSVLMDTLDALSKVATEAERAALAHAILGRASKELLPMIKDHQELKAAVREAGVAIDEHETKALLEADKAMHKLALTWEEVKKSLAAKLTKIVVPVVIEITRELKGGFDPESKVEMAAAAANPVIKKAIQAGWDKLSGDTRDLQGFADLTDAMADSRKKMYEVSKKVALEALPGAQEAARMTEAFKAMFAASREGLEERLKAITEERAKLAAVLKSGAIKDPTIYKEKTEEYAELGKQQERIEGLLKKGHDAEIRRAEMELDQKMAHTRELFGFQSDHLAQLLAIGKITGEERYAQQQALDDREKVQLLALLDEKMAITKRLDPNNAAALQAILGAKQGIEDAYARKTQANTASAAEAKKKAADKELEEFEKLQADMQTHRLKALEDDKKQTEEHLAIATKARDIELSSDTEHEKHLEAIAKSELDFKEKTGQIGVKQHEAQLRIIEDATFKSAEHRMQYELDTLDRKDKQYQIKEAELLKKLRDLRDAHNLEIQKSDQALFTAQLKVFDTFFSGISRAFQQSLQGVIQGTQTIQQAFAKMGQSILLSWISDLAQMLLKHAQTLVGMAVMDEIYGVRKATAAAKAGAAQAATDDLLLLKQMDNAALAATAGQLARSVEGAAAVTSAAAIGAANAYASTALIPIVGPELAPGVATATDAAIMAFLPQASAERGALMAHDSLTMLHANEMVLPARLSQGVQAMIDGGTAGGKDVHVHYAPKVHTLDSTGFKRAIKNNFTEFVGAIKSAHRDGAFA